MEEDLKVLEELKNKKYIVDKVEGWEQYLLTTRQQIAIENLIARNKELEENQCCMTVCMRKDKEKLFFENKTIALIEELTKVNPANLSEEGLKLFNKINEIIDRNKELEKLSENIKMFRDNNLSSEIDYVIALKSNFMEYLKTDYISKSKAEELLKRLDKEEKEKLKGVKGQDRYFIKQMYQAKRSVIEELLQKGDK